MCSSSMLQAGAYVAQGISDDKTGRVNARQAIAEGTQALLAANAEGARIQTEGDRFLGTMRSVQAASGVDLSSGNAADVAAESARNIELDRLNAVHRGKLAMWSKRVEASQQRAAGRASLLNNSVKAYATVEEAAAKAITMGA